MGEVPLLRLVGRVAGRRGVAGRRVRSETADDELPAVLVAHVERRVGPGLDEHDGGRRVALPRVRLDGEAQVAHVPVPDGDRVALHGVHERPLAAHDAEGQQGRGDDGGGGARDATDGRDHVGRLAGNITSPAATANAALPSSQVVIGAGPKGHHHSASRFRFHPTTSEPVT